MIASRIFGPAKHLVNGALRQVGLKLIQADSIHFPRDTTPFGVSLPNDLARLSVADPIRCIFDVGANVGQFAESFAGHCPTADIWSFEPVPESYEQLAKLAVRHPKIRPFKLALGDKEEQQSMNLYPISTMNSLAANPMFESIHSFPTSSIEVSVTRLDEFCRSKEIAKIDLLKIDTEGFDLQVLHGARATLERRAVRFVVTEFFRPNPQPDHEGGALSDVAAFLSGFDIEFVTAYTDHVMPAKAFFGVHNALFALRE